MKRFEVNSNKRPFANQIRVGRGFEGWATFNGKMGDVCVYKVALSDAGRIKSRRRSVKPKIEKELP
jgi:hypothetical protein